MWPKTSHNISADISFETLEQECQGSHMHLEIFFSHWDLIVWIVDDSLILMEKYLKGGGERGIVKMEDDVRYNLTEHS